MHAANIGHPMSLQRPMYGTIQWVSVGEQDIAIFFDDPKHQLSRHENSL